MSDASAMANLLLSLKAVSVSPRKPFTWASGLRSPIYCDNRLIISTVVERRMVIDAFSRLIEAEDWHPDLIAGTATAGIPHAAWLAEKLALPMVYVRGAEKKHGKGNRIEGLSPEGRRTVLIEDLISTGGSSVSAAQALREAGARVTGVAAIFQYGLEKSRVRFAEAALPYATLTDFETLLTEAVASHLLQPDEVDIMRQWRQDPQLWSANHGGA